METIAAYRKTKPLIHLFLNLPLLAESEKPERRAEVKKRIQSLTAQRKYTDPQILDIIEFVIKDTVITFEDIISKSRVSDIVKLRFVIIHLIIENNPRMPLKIIARNLKRDHSTIIHARDSVRNDMGYNSSYKKYILGFEKGCKEMIISKESLLSNVTD